MKRILASILIASTLLLSNATLVSQPPYVSFGVEQVLAATCDSLTSWWSNNEVSGTRADSVVASANDLTDNNTVASAAGKVSNAADFEKDNADEYLSRTDATQTGLDVSGNLSIAAWVKPETLDGLIASKYDSNALRQYWFGSIVSGKLQFIVSDDGSSSATHFIDVNTTAAQLSAATWAFVVVTFNISTEEILIYVNGSSVAIEGQAGESIGASLYNGTAAFSLGSAFSTGTSVDEMDGLLDEVGIWSKVLSGTEITALYNSGNGVSYATACAAAAAVNVGIKKVYGE